MSFHQMEEALLTQQVTALKSDKEGLEGDLSRSEASNKALQADKVALQSDVNRLTAHRDRLVAQKTSLRVGARLSCALP